MTKRYVLLIENPIEQLFYVRGNNSIHHRYFNKFRWGSIFEIVTSNDHPKKNGLYIESLSSCSHFFGESQVIKDQHRCGLLKKALTQCRNYYITLSFGFYSRKSGNYSCCEKYYKTSREKELIIKNFSKMPFYKTENVILIDFRF